jgi:peptide deformylase
MKTIKDSLLHIEDQDPILRTKLFNVPMRLFRSNHSFRKVILYIISHMRAMLNSKYDDYPEVRGISGANVGIPYNIIIVKDRKEERVFINPLMSPLGDETVEVESNCGSIILDRPIKVRRHKKIVVSWYDEEFGQHHTEEFEGQVGNTIQHEIEHNLGILITDAK